LSRSGVPVLIATEFAIALLKEGGLELAMAFSYDDLYELLSRKQPISAFEVRREPIADRQRWRQLLAAII
jgi:hypothetical protein